MGRAIVYRSARLNFLPIAAALQGNSKMPPRLVGENGPNRGAADARREPVNRLFMGLFMELSMMVRTMM
jgi:hypothetical protein